MPRIPLGDFGYAAPETVPGPRLRPGMTTDLGGLVKAGEGLFFGGIRLAEQQRRDLKEARELKERSEAARIHTTYEVDADTISNDVLARVQRGELTGETAPQELQRALSKRKGELIEGLPKERTELLANGFISADGRALSNIARGVTLDWRQRTRANVAASLENLQREAIGGPQPAIAKAHAILDEAAPGSFSPEEIQSAKQSFRETAWFSAYNRAIVASEGDAKALTKLEESISKSSDLDPDRATALLARITNEKQSIAAREEAARQRHLSRVDKAIGEQRDVILKGYPVNPAEISGIQRAAKGTELEADAQRLGKLNTYLSKFNSATPAQMETELVRLEASMRKKGASVDADTIEMRDKLGQLYRNTREQLREDPMTYAQTRGLAPVSVLDFTDPQKLVTQIRGRVDVARGMSKQYGSPMRILLPEEAEQVSRTLAQATPDQKRAYFSLLSQAIEDQGAYAGVMAQIAPDSPVTAVAGVIANRPSVKVKTGWFGGTREFTARRVSDLMLAGEALLNPTKADRASDGRSKFVMPPDKQLNAAFASAADQAFAGAPKARDAAYQSAKAVYAALSAEASDYSGEFNADRWITAITLATGGIVKYNGARVLPLYGQDEATFTDRAANAVRIASKAGRIEGPLDELLKAPLENAGDGVYRIRRGTGYWLDRNGEPAKIDLYTPQPGSGSSYRWKPSPAQNLRRGGASGKY